MSIPFASILHREALQSLAGQRTMARGRDYFERGKVTELHRHGTGISGVVQGESPYSVRLWVKDNSLAYSCTCPMGAEGTLCKHCVALSLSWLARSAAENPPEK